MVVPDEHKYHIAGYEKPAAFNKLGLFDLVMKGPVAVMIVWIPSTPSTTATMVRRVQPSTRHSGDLL